MKLFISWVCLAKKKSVKKGKYSFSCLKKKYVYNIKLYNILYRQKDVRCLLVFNQSIHQLMLLNSMKSFGKNIEECVAQKKNLINSFSTRIIFSFPH